MKHFSKRLVWFDVFRIASDIIGGLMVLFALREMFADLFHPTKSGSLSTLVARQLFNLLRQRPSMLPAAGPTALIVTIGSWLGLLSLGFAFIFWGHLETGFRLPAGEVIDAPHGFVSSLYISIGALTTLGLGDASAKTDWVRVLISIESMLGISLVTASITSFVLLYPALSRMRMLARRGILLSRASKRTGVDVVSEQVEHLLSDLALDVIRTRVDFIHFPIIYYFHSGTDHVSLALALRHMNRFAEAGLKTEGADRVRLAAAMLSEALRDLAQVLANRFVHGNADDPDAVFRAVAAEHREPSQ